MDWERLKIHTWGLIAPWRWNAMIDELAGCAIKSFRGGTFLRAVGVGTWLDVSPGVGGASANHPLKCLDASTVVEETVTNKIRVVFGMIGDVEADEMTLGDVTPAEIEVTGTGWVYAECEIAGGYVSSWSIQTGATVPDDDFDEGKAYLKLCSFAITDDVLTLAQVVGGSQEFQECGLYYFGLV